MLSAPSRLRLPQLLTSSISPNDLISARSRPDVEVAVSSGDKARRGPNTTCYSYTSLQGSQVSGAFMMHFSVALKRPEEEAAQKRTESLLWEKIKIINFLVTEKTSSRAEVGATSTELCGTSSLLHVLHCFSLTTYHHIYDHLMMHTE